jgi:hypothetical protein
MATSFGLVQLGIFFAALEIEVGIKCHQSIKPANILIAIQPLYLIFSVRYPRYVTKDKLLGGSEACNNTLALHNFNLQP